MYNINHKTSLKISVLSGTNRSMSYLPLACEFSRQQYRAAHARVWEQISPKTRMTRGLCQKIPSAKCQNETNLLFLFTGISSRVVRPKSDEKGRDLLLAELAESALTLLHIKSPMHKTRKTQPSRISLLSDHQHRESSSWKSCLGLKTRGQDPKVLGQLSGKSEARAVKKNCNVSQKAYFGRFICRHATPSGNRTRVSPVAGAYSTTRPTVSEAVSPPFLRCPPAARRASYCAVLPIARVSSRPSAAQTIHCNTSR